jgi:hypothetical protein
VAENLLTRLPKLTKTEFQELEACGLHPLSKRQHAIEIMLQYDSYWASSMFGLGRSVYATPPTLEPV